MIASIHNLHPALYRTAIRPFQTVGQKRAAENHPSQSADTVQISKQGTEQLKVSLNQPSTIPGEQDLSAEQRRELENLKKRDREVKAHERAHVAAGAEVVVGGANHQYQRGPDGHQALALDPL